MKQISFTIPGEPRLQKRHRDRKGGGKYDPSAKDKESFLVQAMAQCRPDVPLTGGLTLVVLCFGKSLRGDIDNYLKFVMDALNGIYYVDDKQIRQVSIGLYLNEQPGTRVYLSPSEVSPAVPV